MLRVAQCGRLQRCVWKHSSVARSWLAVRDFVGWRIVGEELEPAEEEAIKEAAREC